MFYWSKRKTCRSRTSIWNGQVEPGWQLSKYRAIHIQLHALLCVDNLFLCLGIMLWCECRSEPAWFVECLSHSSRHLTAQTPDESAMTSLVYTTGIPNVQIQINCADGMMMRRCCRCCGCWWWWWCGCPFMMRAMLLSLPPLFRSYPLYLFDTHCIHVFYGLHTSNHTLTHGPMIIYTYVSQCAPATSSQTIPTHRTRVPWEIPMCSRSRSMSSLYTRICSA